MYEFIKNQWILGKFTVTQVSNCVVKGYITEEQAKVILVMPQEN
jgi:hypothetical protein